MTKLLNEQTGPKPVPYMPGNYFSIYMMRGYVYKLCKRNESDNGARGTKIGIPKTFYYNIRLVLAIFVPFSKHILVNKITKLY